MNEETKKQKKFTIKQSQFISYYLANNGNATQAAIKAGYSKRTAGQVACEILKNPNIVQEISNRQSQAMEKIDITFEWKIEKLKEALEAALDGRGTPTGAVNVSGVVNCINELNKMHGHHSAEKVINTNINSDIDRDVMAELIKKYTKEY